MTPSLNSGKSAAVTIWAKSVTVMIPSADAMASLFSGVEKPSRWASRAVTGSTSR
jgi:hypothetical protein